MTPRFCRALIRCTSFAVPAAERVRWLDEWQAELDHGWQNLPAGLSGLRRRAELTGRVLQAPSHAWALGSRLTALDHLRQDMTLAVRSLARRPSFALVAIPTLALGIGANTAIFTLVNGTLLRPLPFADPASLASVWETVPSQRIDRNTPAPATLEFWRARATDTTFAAYSTATGTLTGGEAERVSLLRASWNLLETLGLQPDVGRGFTRDEDRFGGPPVVLLSSRVWTRRYQRDPTLVGRTIALDGRGAVVVGILPDTLPLSIRDVDAWVPLALKPSENPQSRMLWVVARLPTGGTPARLQARLDLAMHASGPNQPYDGIGVSVRSMDDELRGDVRPDLLLVLGVSGVVLLIACSNLGMMTMSRGLGRTRELKMRAALGASRARLAMTLLVESLVIGIAGGAAGMIVGFSILRVVRGLMPAQLAASVSGDIDARVLAVSAAVSLLTALLFGIAPVVTLSARTLVVSSRGGTGLSDRRARVVRHGLVVVEMALAVVLLAGAALLVKSFVGVVSTPTGFSSSNVLTAQVYRSDTNDERRAAFYQRLVDEASTLPGVNAAGVINGLPLRFTGGGSGFHVDDGQTPARVVSGHHRIVSAGYFEAMAIPMLRGGSFASATSDSEPVAVVSQSFADEAWGRNTEAIGRRIQWGADGRWIRVVGVCGDIRLTRTLPVEPHVYLPYVQVPYAVYMPGDLVLRTSAAPDALAAPLRALVRQIDPNQPVANVKTLDTMLAQSVGARRFTLSLMTAFAVLALVLASVGIYGVLSYGVGQRTREFGVRMAVGATAGRVRREVLARGVMLATIGAALGLGLSWLLAHSLSTFVVGLASPEAWPMAAAALLLIAVAALACDIPARRAMRIDPIDTLRAD